MIVNCAFCNKTIKLRPSLVKDKNFCSRKHYSDYLKSIRYIDRVCKVCGINFKALRSNVNRGKGTCCSLKCASALSSATKKKDKPIRICKVCGKHFKARIDQIKIGKALYCSSKCYGVWISKNRSGKNSSHYTKRIIKTCIICGKKFGVTSYFKKQKTCSRYCNTQYATSFNVFFNTSIERKIKAWLIDVDIDFEFQKKISNVAFPDFLVDSTCIFADGDYWHKYPEGTDKDRKQDKALKKLGYKILRFWEHDINDNFGMVTQKILHTVGVEVELPSGAIAYGTN